MSLTDNLVAYWKLDEASGTRVDATGRGNDAAPTSTPGNAAGVISSALDIDGTNYKYIAAQNSADLQTGDVDFTLAAWIWFDASSSDYDLIGKWSSSDLEYELALSGQKFRFYLTPDGSSFPGVDATTFGNVSDSTWYFVVLWHDATADTVNICVNAGATDSTSHSAGVRVGTAIFKFGKTDFGVGHFDGRIDEVGFWRRVLTSGERTTLYNAGAGKTFPFGYTLVVETGAVSLGGQAGLAIGGSAVIITPEMIRFAFAIPPHVHRRMAADQGVFVLAGMPATFLRTLLAVAFGKSIVFRPPQVLLRRGYRISAKRNKMKMRAGEAGGTIGLSPELRDVFVAFATQIANQGMSGPPTDIGIYWEPKTSKWVMREEERVLEVLDEA